MNDVNILKYCLIIGLIGLLIGGVLILPVAVFRIIKKQPIFPNSHPVEVPPIRGYGLFAACFFVFISVVSFFTQKIGLGMFFALVALLYLCATIWSIRKHVRGRNQYKR